MLLLQQRIGVNNDTILILYGDSIIGLHHLHFGYSNLIDIIAHSLGTELEKKLEKEDRPLAE
jgi:hypothetical protein